MVSNLAEVGPRYLSCKIFVMFSAERQISLSDDSRIWVFHVSSLSIVSPEICFSWRFNGLRSLMGLISTVPKK